MKLEIKLLCSGQISQIYWFNILVHSAPYNVSTCFVITLLNQMHALLTALKTHHPSFGTSLKILLQSPFRLFYMGHQVRAITLKDMQYEFSNPLPHCFLQLDRLILLCFPSLEWLVVHSQVCSGDCSSGSAISLGLNSQLTETLRATARPPLVIGH